MGNVRRSQRTAVRSPKPAKPPPERNMILSNYRIAHYGFTFLPLGSFCPRLAEIMALRPLLGLRSPAHTVVRTLNPFAARCQIVGVAHPPYRALHRDAARLLGQAAVAVFKGEGGEAERRPDKPCDVAGIGGDETWSMLTEDTRAVAANDMDMARLPALWRGALRDPIAEASVTGTAAIVLKATGRAATQNEAMALAAAMWTAREPLAEAA